MRKSLQRDLHRLALQFRAFSPGSFDSRFMEVGHTDNGPCFVLTDDGRQVIEALRREIREIHRDLQSSDWEDNDWLATHVLQVILGVLQDDDDPEVSDGDLVAGAAVVLESLASISAPAFA